MDQNNQSTQSFGFQIPLAQNTRGESNNSGGIPPQNPFQNRFNINHVHPQPNPNRGRRFNLNPVHPSTIENSIDFNDDEPLPVQSATTTLSQSSLENVSIETYTETPAIAASDFNSSFAVLLGIFAPPLPVGENHRVPIDLVAVLDVSGSMSGEKLTLMKYATKFVIDHMLPSDRLSIVSFSSNATRVLPLRRMTEKGRKDAEFAVDQLRVEASTNIVAGLNTGARVLEQRRQFNPVSSIIFLSDGQDTDNGHFAYRNVSGTPPAYLRLLSSSISNVNNETHNENGRQRFPVYTFGLGTDHDAVAMNAIADGSCGTYSFVESAEMIPRSFARCIGGLFSVVAQDVRIKVSSASPGVEIKSIPSGRHVNEIISGNKQGIIHVGDLFAEEKKEFLIYVSVPVHSYNLSVTDVSKTPLLDIICYYRNAFNEEIVQIDGPSIEIRRPITLSPTDEDINLKVDGQRNRVAVAESIAMAKEMADKGNLKGAKEVLNSSRETLLGSASAQSGAEMVNWLEAELKEITLRMENMGLYDRQGRAFMLSGMSAQGAQRATSRSYSFLKAAKGSFGATGKDVNFAAAGVAFGAAYDTPMMAKLQSELQIAPPTAPPTTLLIPITEPTTAPPTTLLTAPPTTIPTAPPTPLPIPPATMALPNDTTNDTNTRTTYAS